MEKRTKITVAAVVIVVIAIALAGSTYYLSMPKPKEEIVIGVSIEYTGANAKYGKQIDMVYDLWVEDVNARGGLLEKPVRLIKYDDETNPDKAAAAYERLITVDKVNAIIGPHGSLLCWAVDPIAEKYKMPILNMYASTDTIYTKGWKYVFGIHALGSTMGTSYWQGMSDLIARGALNPVPKTVAILTHPSAWFLTSASSHKWNAEKRGFQVVFFEQFPTDINNFAPLLLKIKALNPDIFVLSGLIPNTLLCTKQMKEVDFNPKAFWCDYGPSSSTEYRALGKDALYAVECTTWLETFSEAVAPGNAYLLERWSTKYPEAEAQTDTTVAAYSTCLVLEEAIKMAGSTDPEAMRNALLRIDVNTPSGRVKIGSMKIVLPDLGEVTVENVNIYAAYKQVQAQYVENEVAKNRLVLPVDLAEAPLIYPTVPWAER